MDLLAGHPQSQGFAFGATTYRRTGLVAADGVQDVVAVAEAPAPRWPLIPRAFTWPACLRWSGDNLSPPSSAPICLPAAWRPTVRSGISRSRSTTSAIPRALHYRRGSGDGYRGRIWEEDQGIYLVDARGTTPPRLVTREGRSPRFSKDGRRIYLISGEGDGSALISVNLLGSDRRVLAESRTGRLL